MKYSLINLSEKADIPSTDVFITKIGKGVYYVHIDLEDRFEECGMFGNFQDGEINDAIIFEGWSTSQQKDVRFGVNFFTDSFIIGHTRKRYWEGTIIEKDVLDSVNIKDIGIQTS